MSYLLLLQNLFTINSGGYVEINTITTDIIVNNTTIIQNINIILFICAPLYINTIYYSKNPYERK